MKKTILILALLGMNCAQAANPSPNPKALFPHIYQNEPIPTFQIKTLPIMTTTGKPPTGTEYIQYRRKDCHQDLIACVNKKGFNFTSKDKCKAAYIDCRYHKTATSILTPLYLEAKYILKENI